MQQTFFSHTKATDPSVNHSPLSSPSPPSSKIYASSRTRWILPTWQKNWKYYFNDNFDANGRKAFEAHNSHIKDIVPAENLLVYHVKDGWEPLCEFLGKSVPLDGKWTCGAFPEGEMIRGPSGIGSGMLFGIISLELGERVLRVVVVLYFILGICGWGGFGGGWYLRS
ncbi:hypothetical protein BO83DRAFT_461497 [Aspergillus eucalypticola CBS 122712]|uniref:Uncharacterized protein n=1 Tax=Aspergillus eucalypticola (strain CBS 122712 / IBT 29274) TaxID=1448314 RepID=A0A317VXA8_ASPEC|nr:uncharacterized protein BO83DRAFT_461497 [Aspergillus eucalypticola CBS 122712]PWY77587.1 hypothetical protein BO83DRAFT_461497 [Aspergillus eucalypticola CBS 122712]